MKYIVIMPARGCAQPKKGGLVKKGQKRSDVIYGFPLWHVVVCYIFIS